MFFISFFVFSQNHQILHKTLKPSQLTDILAFVSEPLNKVISASFILFFVCFFGGGQIRGGRNKNEMKVKKKEKKKKRNEKGNKKKRKSEENYKRDTRFPLGKMIDFNLSKTNLQKSQTPISHNNPTSQHVTNGVTSRNKTIQKLTQGRTPVSRPKVFFFWDQYLRRATGNNFSPRLGVGVVISVQTDA